MIEIAAYIDQSGENEYTLITPLYNTLVEFEDFIKKCKIDENSRIKLTDNMLFCKNKKIINSRGPRGKALDVKSTKYTGDANAVKDVYFLRNTTFDRAYFKRLYPDINIRKNISNADIILYDDSAVFTNDIQPIVYTCFDMAGTKYCVDPSHGIPYFYQQLKTHHSIARYKINLENGCEIINYIINNGGYNRWSGVTESKSFYRIRENIENEYFKKIVDSKKPLMSVLDFFSVRNSEARSENLKYSELISLAHQLTSCDNNISMAACDALIQYNPKRYLPIQSFLFFMATKEVNYVHFCESKKFKIFKTAYLDQLNGVNFLRNKQICPHQDVIQFSNNLMLAYSKLIHWVSEWSNNDFSGYDISDLLKFLYSTDFLEIFGPKNKNHTNGSNSLISINIGSILWTINNEKFKNPNYYNCTQQPVAVEIASSGEAFPQIGQPIAVEQEFGL
jgi:hypothetical protein